MFFLSKFIEPWLLQYFPRCVAPMEPHYANVEIPNERSNVHDAREYLRMAICSLAMAKLNGEAMNRDGEFAEELEIFETLFMDDDFGTASKWRIKQRNLLARLPLPPETHTKETRLLDDDHSFEVEQ